MNKKGYSFSSWAEIALVVVLFLGTFTAVISEMNVLYGTDFSTGIGDTVNGTEISFRESQDAFSDDILEGEPEISSEGLTLKSSWKIIRSVSSTLWSFISGGIIYTIIVEWMMLPEALADTLLVLWLFSITLAVLMLLFRRKP